MRYLLVIALLLVAGIQQGFAAFPIKKTAATTITATEQTPPSNIISGLPAPVASYDRGGDGRDGIVAAGLAGGGLLSYLTAYAFILQSSSLGLGLFIVGTVLGIGAIIFGAKGLRKKNGGWACAGMVLGIIEVSIGIVVGLLVILLALAFGGM